MKIDFLKNLGLGTISLESYITFEEGKIVPNYKVEESKDCVVLSYQEKDYSDCIKFTKCNTGYTVVRTFKNLGEKTLKLKDLSVRMEGIDFGGDKKDDYFYSTENPRIYETFTFPVDYCRTADDVDSSEYDVIANNRWADPGVVSERVNDSPYQPFPAILLSNYKKKVGLVHGTLCQDVFFHSYLTGHEDGVLYLDIRASFKVVKYLEVESGRTLVDEWYIGRTDKAEDINCLFDGYTAELRKKISSGWGAKDINRHELVWGSWNDGLFRDVTHDMLIKEARALKSKFPMVKWFQLDDGYAAFHEAYGGKTSAHGIGVAYKNDEGIDMKKFPYGLKAYVDEVKEIGFRPAVWIGCYADKKSAVYKENPNWFINYDYRIPNTSPFDFSIEDAREFLLSGQDLFTKEYGFEAVKHDFWSYQFETTGDFCKNLTKSGYEYRDWWARELRSRIPEDGYLESACDLCQGNPFLGKYFNNYRYGIDVADGKWDNIRTVMQWGTACISTHTGDLFVPNSDSIGMFPALSFSEFLYWTTYVLITRSMVELAGLYSKDGNDEKRVEVLKKATCNVNNGENAYFVNFDYRKSGKNVPEVIYIDTAHFTNEVGKGLPVKTVAMFNSSEEEKDIDFAFEDIGLVDKNYVLTDVWTGEQFVVNSGFEAEIPAHSCRLLSVSEIELNAVLDADVKLENVVKGDNNIDFTVPYAREGKITFSSIPKKVRVDGEGEATIEKSTLNIVTKGACRFSVEF